MSIRSFASVRRLLVLFVAALLVGCDMTRTLDLEDRDHESRLVLQGRFQPGEPWRARVSQSVGAFEPGRVRDERFAVTDATIEVFRGDQRMGTLTRDTLSRYSTDAFAPSPEGAYTVRATAPGLDSVAATDRVPSVPPARLSVEEEFTEERVRWRPLRLTIEDPQAAQNYYRIVLEAVFEPDSGATVRDRRTFRTQNQAVLEEMGESFELEDDNTYRGSEAVFTDALFDGQTYTIDLEVRNRGRRGRDQSSTSTFELQVQVLSEDTYQYLRTRRLADETDDNPFSSPVDVVGNVEGGYGLMGARNVDTLRQQIAWDEQ